MGNYTSVYFGDASVAVKNGQLTMALGPAKIGYKLQHWDGDEFVIDLAKGKGSAGDAVPGSLTSVWFTIGAGGEASRLAIGSLNGGSCSEPPAHPFSPYVAGG